MVGGPLRSRMPQPDHNVPSLAELAAQARELYPRQSDDSRTSQPLQPNMWLDRKGGLADSVAVLTGSTRRDERWGILYPQLAWVGFVVYVDHVRRAHAIRPGPPNRLALVLFPDKEQAHRRH